MIFELKRCTATLEKIGQGLISRIKILGKIHIEIGNALLI